MSAIQKSDFLMEHGWVITAVLPVVEMGAVWQRGSSVFSPAEAVAFFNFLMAAMMGFLLYYKFRKEMPLTFQKKTALGHAALLLIFFIFLPLFDLEHPMQPVVEAAVFMAMIGSGFFIFIDVREFVRKLNRYPTEVFFGTAAIFCTPVMQLIKIMAGGFFADTALWGSYGILRLLGYDVSIQQAAHVIHHALYEVAVLPVCNGLGGVNSFLVAFSVILIQDAKHISKNIIILFYVMGSLLALFLNILRIVALCMVAIGSYETWGKTEAAENLIGCFHYSAGFQLYELGMVLFFLVFFWAVRKKAYKPLKPKTLAPVSVPPPAV